MTNACGSESVGTSGTLLDRLHSSYVHRRRVRVLSAELARLISPSSTVLDVGSGDGWLASLIRERIPSLDICGIDTLVRPETHISIEQFDGRSIPRSDDSFDFVMFVDVLHHTDDPTMLLREAARVARRAILIKDHLLNGLWAAQILRGMDWVGNARHGVALPFNYWTHAHWLEAFFEVNLAVTFWKTDLQLYPVPVNWVCGRSLHFIARLEPAFAER